MADRKKKYISYKENTKRAPTILSKQDRDFNNENDNKSREKDNSRHAKVIVSLSDKETAGPSSKQTTILIKAREESVRPTSPKRTQNKENDAANTVKAHPSVTVQENNSFSTSNKMSKCVKLIDENMEFNQQALDLLHDNQNDYLVIGVIGGQSVGKSTIMNLLAQNNSANLTSRIMNKPLSKNDSKIDVNGLESKSSSDIYSEHSSSDLLSNSDKSIESNSSNSAEYYLKGLKLSDKNYKYEAMKQFDEFKFRIESLEDIQLGKHCTDGVDMYITSNRVILLDSQPILSPSVMDKMVAMDSKVLPTENAIELESLQIAAFLLGTCHVVILVQDWFLDHNLIRFLHTAEMLKPSNAVSNNDESFQEHFPHILFVQNKATMSDFLTSNVNSMKHVYSMLFKHSKLPISSGICNKNSESSDNVNLFLFPEITSDTDNELYYNGHEKVETLVDKLRQQVFGSSRSSISSNITSEKHWGHFASKAWEQANKSTFFAEYTRLLP